MILIAAALVLVAASLWGWCLQRRTRNAGYADVVWSWGLGLVAVSYLVAGDGDPVARLVASLLIATWSLRLGWHVLARVRAEPEDGRYEALRVRLGERADLFHFFFFLAQGLLAWLFALVFLIIAGHPGGQPLWLAAGLLAGVLGLAGEALADRQLQAFRREPRHRGRTCREGLWRYSRHPNYFFEWLHWFAYPLIAVGAPAGPWVWLAPAVMLVFLRFLTGIPWTERQALRSRGENYRHYQKTTSAFVPWRPSNAD